MSLIHQRCFNHAAREAVARCMECTQFYCRECVTEHENKLICTPCLRRLTEKTQAPGGQFAWVLQLLPSAAGFLVALIFFYLLGQSLLAIPSSFHDAEVWTSFLNEL